MISLMLNCALLRSVNSMSLLKRSDAGVAARDDEEAAIGVSGKNDSSMLELLIKHCVLGQVDNDKEGHVG